ncbi:cytochrome c oxidase subunit 4 isoform 1, mitochondrial-like [Leptopilina heterotoma]|uniref:cytochrome c oxidase subunit 4 isoform 1, mitochondrial-like n=1 Tax=Leptopilina heterotoma TaxID=63436 RepID=UPI001CAA40FE|nr:cytochrome c oxidase subunit 4 isoform 1, mitochondrial-like [Leptopilina heterotoma]
MFLSRSVTKQLTKFKRIPLQTVSVRDSSGHEEEKLSYEDHYRAKIGNREVIAFGLNGTPSYIDLFHRPFPSIRFREFGPELTALREKERGNWKTLSTEEKKCLYRASFCNTFAEMDAPDPEWKSVFGWTLVWISAGLWLFIFYQVYIRMTAPISFSPEHRIAQYYRSVDLNKRRITYNKFFVPPGAVKREHPKNQKMLDELNAQLNKTNSAR